MAGERLETRVGEIEFLWTRCCCGVTCYANIRSTPMHAASNAREVGEYTFVETIEKTALRCQEAAFERARKLLR